MKTIHLFGKWTRCWPIRENLISGLIYMKFGFFLDYLVDYSALREVDKGLAYSEISYLWFEFPEITYVGGFLLRLADRLI